MASGNIKIHVKVDAKKLKRVIYNHHEFLREKIRVRRKALEARIRRKSGTVSSTWEMEGAITELRWVETLL